MYKAFYLSWNSICFNLDVFFNVDECLGKNSLYYSMGIFHLKYVLFVYTYLLKDEFFVVFYMCVEISRE